jgi:hypothetical protein
LDGGPLDFLKSPTTLKQRLRGRLALQGGLVCMKKIRHFNGLGRIPGKADILL